MAGFETEPKPKRNAEGPLVSAKWSLKWLQSGVQIRCKVEYQEVDRRKVDMARTRNPRYLTRVVDGEVVDALDSAPAVLIEGARGVGKTWTGQRFARSEIMLDGSASLRMAAEVDPESILAGEEPRLLDEWQLVRGI